MIPSQDSTHPSTHDPPPLDYPTPQIQPQPSLGSEVSPELAHPLPTRDDAATDSEHHSGDEKALDVAPAASNDDAPVASRTGDDEPSRDTYDRGPVPSGSLPLPLDMKPSSEKASVVESQADDKNKDKTEDKGSLSTTGTQSQTRSFRRKVNKSTASDGTPSSTSINAHSAATNGKPKIPRQKPKPSFFSKLIRKLVPCVAQSPRTHTVDLGDGDTLSTKEQEKPGIRDPEPDGQPPLAITPAETSKKTPPVEPSTSTAARLAPLTIIPPPLSTDDDTASPPTPTRNLLPKSETAGVTSGAVQPPGSGGGILSPHPHQHSHAHGGRNHTDPPSDGDESDETNFTEDDDGEDVNVIEEAEDEEDRLIMNGGAGIPIGPDGMPRPLLPPMAPQHGGRKCLVLDLDETLVHSSFKSIQQADYVVPVEIEYHWHNVYVIKRPGVDNFLKKMGEIYEVVVFTASLSKYADPVLDKLDIHQVVTHRLFRESCYNHKGNYVKDLSQLGRSIADTIILDNSPASYIFHPNNAVPVSSWFNDPHDTELTDLVPFLSDLSTVDDVRGVLDGGL